MWYCILPCSILLCCVVSCCVVFVFFRFVLYFVLGLGPRRGRTLRPRHRRKHKLQLRLGLVHGLRPRPGHPPQAQPCGANQGPSTRTKSNGIGAKANVNLCCVGLYRIALYCVALLLNCGTLAMPSRSLDESAAIVNVPILVSCSKLIPTEEIPFPLRVRGSIRFPKPWAQGSRLVGSTLGPASGAHCQA